MVNQCSEFEVSSFSRSRDNMRTVGRTDIWQQHIPR